MTLFSAEQLSAWLHYDVDPVSCEQAEAVVTGWLLDILEADYLPSITPGDPLYGWALELGGIAYENPTSMTSETSGEESTSWSVVRRAQVLDAVRSWRARTQGASSVAGLPRGRFPSAEPYPDPIRRRCW